MQHNCFRLSALNSARESLHPGATHWAVFLSCFELHRAFPPNLLHEHPAAGLRGLDSRAADLSCEGIRGEEEIV